MKSAKELLSFIQYCIAHPEDRFWQAVRNWSGYHFVLVSDVAASKGMTDSPYAQLRDTFSLERRRHDSD